MEAVTLAEVNLDADYAQALGLFLWCVAGLEDNVVSSIKLIAPESTQQFEKFTTQNIAEFFKARVSSMTQSQEKQELLSAADEFLQLVPLRNQIVHGGTATHEGKHMVVSTHGSPLTLVDIQNAASSFRKCQGRIYPILSGFLKTYKPIA